MSHQQSVGMTSGYFCNNQQRCSDILNMLHTHAPLALCLGTAISMYSYFRGLAVKSKTFQERIKRVVNYSTVYMYVHHQLTVSLHTYLK